MSGLGAPRIIYGIHSITPYSRADKTFYGILKVVGSANIALSSSLEQLYAGSNKFSWAAESKTIDTTVTAKVKAYPGFLFQLFLGASVTENTADTSGTVSTLTNVLGTSVMNSTTGIASVAVKSGGKANLKFGKYVIKALTSSTIAIYAASDIDFGRGTVATYADDSLKITETTITITSGGATDLNDLGLEFTGGSGTIGMTVGDTASFEVKPPSTASTDIVVGSSTTTFPAFGAIFLSQKRTTGEMFEIDAPNVSAVGLPIQMEELKFSEVELKMSLLYDAPSNKVFSIRGITPA